MVIEDDEHRRVTGDLYLQIREANDKIHDAQIKTNNLIHENIILNRRVSKLEEDLKEAKLNQYESW